MTRTARRNNLKTHAFRIQRSAGRDLGCARADRASVGVVACWPARASITIALLVTTLLATGCNKAPAGLEFEAFDRGPFAVGATNLEIDAERVGGYEGVLHGYLVGRTDSSGSARYLADILTHPGSALTTRVAVPDEPAMYGAASGSTLPIVSYLTYPTQPSVTKNPYRFPYHDARYGAFEDMLEAGEVPEFAEPREKYPLIILSHGFTAHGIYDVGHAHHLASHGFVVAVIHYGDKRIASVDRMNNAIVFLRPLLTRAVLDTILADPHFGPRIDVGHIGITGHSLGGTTALALTGADFLGNEKTVHDPRIKAATIAAPWVGDDGPDGDAPAFGPGNGGLAAVSAPMLTFFGTRDQIIPMSYMLPAIEQLAGPSYVVELVDQPHVFDAGSWQDRDNWELLFFAAYLKNDADAMQTLQTAGSATGGNIDWLRARRGGRGGSDHRLR